MAGTPRAVSGRCGHGGANADICVQHSSVPITCSLHPQATLARALQKHKQHSVISAFTTRKVQIGNWSLLLSLASR